MESVVHIARYHSHLALINVAASALGIVSLDFNSSVKSFSASLMEGRETCSDIRIENSETRFVELFTLFDRYFSGKDTTFDSVKVDFYSTPFRLRVWKELRKVPFGCVVSYAELAGKIGLPHGARALGGACARNPVPLIVPCHRVISSGGRIGGYSAGVKGVGLGRVELKRALLENEGIFL